MLLLNYNMYVLLTLLSNTSKCWNKKNHIFATELLFQNELKMLLAASLALRQQTRLQHFLWSCRRPVSAPFQRLLLVSAWAWSLPEILKQLLNLFIFSAAGTLFPTSVYFTSASFYFGVRSIFWPYVFNSEYRLASTKEHHCAAYCGADGAHLDHNTVSKHLISLFWLNEVVYQLFEEESLKTLR